MDADMLKRFDQLEKRLKAIEKLGQEIKSALDDISSEILITDNSSTIVSKLDEILEAIKPE